MRLKYLPLLACVSLLASCSDKKGTGTASTNLASGTVSFPNYGFSIKAFDSAGRGPQIMALDMQLNPAISPLKFPNVNVQLHTSNGTLAEFLKQMRDDFAKINITVYKETAPSSGVATVEYLGVTSNAFPIHWYSKLIQSGNTIYIAVGMSQDTLWSVVGDRLKACVDSLTVNGSGATPPGNTVQMPNYGFSIAPFDFPLNNYAIQPLMMSLPPESGFSPSVNVQIQLAPTGMETYMSDSTNLMAQKNFSIREQRTSNNNKEWFLEYLGAVPVTQANGQSSAAVLRWYAHAIWSNGRVYLATGGVPENLWNTYSAQIKACVDSLAINGAPIVATPAPEPVAPATPAPSANGNTTTPAPAASGNTTTAAAAAGNTTTAPLSLTSGNTATATPATP